MLTQISTDSFTNYGLDSEQYTTVFGGWTLPINNARALAMCGDCGWPTALHPIKSDFTDDMICEADFTNGLRSDYDFFLHATNDGSKANALYTDRQSISIYTDHSGNEANIVALIDGVVIDGTTYRIEDSLADYDNGEDEFLKIERWHDQDPKVCTHAIDWQYINMNTGEVLSGSYDGPRLPKGDWSESYSQDTTRSAYVDGITGFITMPDPANAEATVNYQARLLNQFTHKRTGKYHVGSIEFTFDGDTIIATCINKQCYRKDLTGNYVRAAVKVNKALVERPAMEAFIYDVIRHGNNHGPDWLTSRPDWYKLHHVDCDLNCTGLTCNSNEVRNNFIDNDIEFVMDHQKYCKDSKCKCSEWLANEVPALKENVA